MAYSIVAGFAPAFRFEKAGDAFEGTFASSKKVKKEVFESGSCNFHELDDLKGKRWSIMGSKTLDEAFKRLRPGTKVRITYGGTASFKVKGKPRRAHRYTVEVDDGK